jgi:hypothetical protein
MIQQRNSNLHLYVLEFFGAEGGTRTPTGVHPLDPEPSASANSATSATGMLSYAEDETLSSHPEISHWFDS